MATRTAAEDPTKVRRPDFRELGISGTRLYSGLISEETVPQLQGQNAYRSYTGMKFDATASAIYKSVELPIRSARWFIDPASDDPKAVEMADFVHDVLWDFGDQSMDDVLRLALSMLPYGFSWLEILWAYIDSGPWKGKVGWHQLAYRSQATKWKWNLEWINGRRQLVSVTQQAPPNYNQVEIPSNKLLIFTHEREGDNWDGISLFRPAWKSYFLRDRLYRIQAIGLERSYMGVPVATLPEGYGDELRDLAKQIVTTLRVDEQAGVIKPEELTLEILKGEIQGPAMHEAIQHHNRQMLLSQLAQFLDLGSGQAGAYSLSSDHSELFLQAVNSRANYLAQVVNLEPGIQSLVTVNFANVDHLDCPKLEHGDIGTRALATLGRTLQALGQWGFLTPDPETEGVLRRWLDLPEREDTVTDRALYDLVQEVFPHPDEFGTVYPAKAVTPALGPGAGGGKGTGPVQKQTPAPKEGQPGSPAEDTANMRESRHQFAEAQHRVTELLARRRWDRPRGRLTEADRMRVTVTEQFAEALEEVGRTTEYNRAHRPPRPSEVVARNRRPYVVRAATRRTEPPPDHGQATRQRAMAARYHTTLTDVLRPRPQPPRQ